jgi:hypothetical protein
MSWDVVIFNLKRKINSVEEVNEDVLQPIATVSDFCKMILLKFPDSKIENQILKIINGEGEVVYYVPDENESFSNTILHLYGKDAIYIIIDMCKHFGWHAFDTGLGEMLDLENPERNGYENFQAYLNHVLKNS